MTEELLNPSRNARVHRHQRACKAQSLTYFTLKSTGDDLHFCGDECKRGSDRRKAQSRTRHRSKMDGIKCGTVKALLKKMLHKQKRIPGDRQKPPHAVNMFQKNNMRIQQGFDATVKFMSFFFNGTRTQKHRSWSTPTFTVWTMSCSENCIYTDFFLSKKLQSLCFPVISINNYWTTASSGPLIWLVERCSRSAD